MKKKMFLLFSHKLTEDQIREAKEIKGVTGFVSLPEDLQHDWSNVPPELADYELEDYAKRFYTWLDKNGDFKTDLTLCAGDPGLVHLIVSRYEGCIYATTKRETVTETLPDGSVKKTNVFKHYKFRYFSN